MAGQNAKVRTTGESMVSTIAPKSIARTRQDVSKWNSALTAARKGEDPKRWLLQLLYDEIMIDALLTSQIENRRNKSLSQSFQIEDKKGKINQELTDLLQNKKWVNEINKAILDSKYYGHSVIEFEWTIIANEPALKTTLFDRTNIEPVNGLFFADYTEDKFIKYRDALEYGTWIIEFGDPKDMGLLNKAIPHVLFKRFAQSCWSELCEIAGIPPRVMKTNTQDVTMVRRAEKMMKDMGAAAWFIIDDNETFEWADANNSTGAVYNSLMNFCDNQLSMLTSGAIIGQDTKNGSRSKDESAQSVLQDLVDADLSFIEQCWNDIVIPALLNIGAISGECVYKYSPTEDVEQLWKIASGLLTHYDIPAEWINDKFNIPVTEKVAAQETENKQKLSADFFA